MTFDEYTERLFPTPTVEGSQYGEDAILEKLLPESFGWFIDVGAHHPIDCNNSWRFYQRGWRGILIEPLPSCWPNLLFERAEDYLCPVAAGSERAVMEMRVCRSVSSMLPGWPQSETEGIMPVLTVPLVEILSWYPQIDSVSLLSVDVEGMERQVLEGYPWETHPPKVICIEWCDPNGVDISGPVLRCYPVLVNLYRRL